MKYFILYTAGDEEDQFSNEFYIKGRSTRQVLKLIEQFSNGWIHTSLFGLCTRNIKYGFLREVNLNHYSDLSSKDFAHICEGRCVSF
jgi:hypothetical protein